MKQPQQEAARISQRAIAQYSNFAKHFRLPRNKFWNFNVNFLWEREKEGPPTLATHIHTVKKELTKVSAVQRVFYGIRNSIITCYIIVSPLYLAVKLKERFSDNSLCLYGSVLICLSSVNFHSFHPAPPSSFVFSIDFFFSSNPDFTASLSSSLF